MRFKQGDRWMELKASSSTLDSLVSLQAWLAKQVRDFYEQIGIINQWEITV